MNLLNVFILCAATVILLDRTIKARRWLHARAEKKQLAIAAYRPPRLIVAQAGEFSAVAGERRISGTVEFVPIVKFE